MLGFLSSYTLIWQKRVYARWMTWPGQPPQGVASQGIASQGIARAPANAIVSQLELTSMERRFSICCSCFAGDGQLAARSAAEPSHWAAAADTPLGLREGGGSGGGTRGGTTGGKAPPQLRDQGRRRGGGGARGPSSVSVAEPPSPKAGHWGAEIPETGSPLSPAASASGDTAGPLGFKLRPSRVPLSVLLRVLFRVASTPVRVASDRRTSLEGEASAEAPSHSSEPLSR